MGNWDFESIFYFIAISGFLFLFLIVLMGSIFVLTIGYIQRRLSASPYRWLGLLLPSFWFLRTLWLFITNVWPFSIFLLFNIPTALLILIYITTPPHQSKNTNYPPLTDIQEEQIPPILPGMPMDMYQSISKDFPAENSPVSPEKDYTIL